MAGLWIPYNTTYTTNKNNNNINDVDNYVNGLTNSSPVFGLGYTVQINHVEIHTPLS